MPSAARGVAFEVLRRTFEDGAYTDLAFTAAAGRAGLQGRERAQAQRIAYGAVQRRGTADALIERLTARQVERIEPPLLAALRVGLFELLFADSTPDHAAVSEAVELAKRAASKRGAGLVNAVLRRAIRERGSILADLDDSTPAGAAVALSYPEWLCELWWEELGAQDARSLMAAMNQPAETALRVNTLRADPSQLADALADEGVSPAAEGFLGPREALVVAGQIGPETSRRIDAGELVPQSRASQAVVALLDPQPGERVLDLCAGPGIKTTAIAARMADEGQVVAVELDPARAERTAGMAARLGAGCIEVVTADARELDQAAVYDRVLVDPPCSDLGTLAARPDARWRKSPEGIERLAKLSAEILAAGAGAARPGGFVVHSTCTISKAENERVLGAAVAAGGVAAEPLGDAQPGLAAADPRFLQTRPDRDGTSGFFMARLQAGGAA
ncbi:MAG: rRNA (cytosine967-C5)-methyltransferase [Solirubrobacterales bacterium]|nr:rRNA (cytosine967-C5)-methyltransferase [Solirubrobacterales bacterium]